MIPQLIVVGTMAFTVISITSRTRDDEPIERFGAVVGTVIICGVVAYVLNSAGFWDAMIR